MKTPADNKKLAESVLALIEQARDDHRRGERLLKVLEMQARVLLQGVSIDNIATYGYDPKKDVRRPPVPPLKRAEWRQANPVYNYVVMADGARIDIEPVPVAPQPEEAPCSSFSK